MALEALMGGNSFLTLRSHLDFLPLITTPLFQMSLIGTTT
jgi:hypothetical protein